MIETTIVVFDIDGVVRDVSGSYRRALADTVEQFTLGAYRPSQEDIDALKTEGQWNNDWEASQEMIYRYFETQGRSRQSLQSDANPVFTYEELVAFFQSRYRGTDPIHWNGYICQEPLLMEAAYLDSLTQAGIRWGFFSGATRGSAGYVLEKRLGLQTPVLVAMEDAPGKPDPTGLLHTVAQLQPSPESRSPVVYVGDTVADMFTVKQAREQYPDRSWLGVGVIPPHAQADTEQQNTYAATLRQAGAAIVLDHVQELTPGAIDQLLGG